MTSPRPHPDTRFDPGRLPDRLRDTLAEIPDAGRVWVALSGGLDSTCLLHAAAAVRERLPGPLHAAHIDHGLHPDSAHWSERCQALCDALAVPLAIRRLDLKPARGESPEAVARDARYAALAALLAPGDLLLTAHTRDDQAETLLLALLRGSGVHGLAAMPALAPLGPGRLVRPLLPFTRAALAAYARAEGLVWIEDPSNASLAPDRNFLRHRVLPVLRERWPGAAATLARSAAHCAEAADLVDRAAAAALPALAGTRPGTLRAAGLLALDPALRKAVVRLWLRRLGRPLPDRARLERVAGEVLAARADAAPLVVWPGCEVRRFRGDLLALPPLPPPPGPEIELIWTGGRLRLPGELGTLEWDAYPPGAPALRVRFGGAPSRAGAETDAEADSDAGSGPGRAAGGRRPLRCRPLGRSGTRTLKRLFQDAGVPAWLRPYCPLVLDGDRLAAVAGVCACADGAGHAPGPDRAAGPQAPARADTDPVAVANAAAPGAPRLRSAPRWRGHPWEALGLFA